MGDAFVIVYYFLKKMIYFTVQKKIVSIYIIYIHTIKGSCCLPCIFPSFPLIAQNKAH
jgi:hypothetical protein